MTPGQAPMMPPQQQSMGMNQGQQPPQQQQPAQQNALQLP